MPAVLSPSVGSAWAAAGLTWQFLEASGRGPGNVTLYSFQQCPAPLSHLVAAVRGARDPHSSSGSSTGLQVFRCCTWSWCQGNVPPPGALRGVGAQPSPPVHHWGARLGRGQGCRTRGHTGGTVSWAEASP